MVVSSSSCSHRMAFAFLAGAQRAITARTRSWRTTTQPQLRVAAAERHLHATRTTLQQTQQPPNIGKVVMRSPPRVRSDGTAAAAAAGAHLSPRQKQLSGPRQLVQAGLPLVLFALLSAWVVRNAYDGKLRELEASQGKASKSVRQAASTYSSSVSCVCACVYVKQRAATIGAGTLGSDRTSGSVDPVVGAVLAQGRRWRCYLYES